MIDPNTLTPNKNIILSESQTCAAHMGISAINSFCIQISSSRNMMSSNQVTSALGLKSPDRKILSSGFNTDMSKYVMDITVPVNCVVVKIIKSGSGQNARTVILYEEDGNNQLGMIDVPTFATYKTIYGFNYTPRKVLSDLRVGSRLTEGLVLASTPTTRYGGADYGVNLNLCLISMEETGEDGIIVNEDSVDKLSYYTHTTLTIPVKKNQVLLDLFSSELDDNHLCLPTVGSKVREDGIIAVARTMRGIHGDEDTAGAVNMLPSMGTKSSLRKINFHSDKVYQMKGAANGEIVKVSVIRGFSDDVNRKRDVGSIEFTGWTQQLDGIAKKSNMDRMEIYEAYKEHCSKYNLDIDDSNITKELSNYLVNTIALDIHHNRDGKVPNFRNANHPNSRNSLRLIIKKEKLPSYYIEVTVKKLCRPRLGGKMTDLVSAKGVITKFLPANRMPKDANGRVTDVACSIEASVNRSVVGRNSDMYISDACQTLTDKIRIRFGLTADSTDRAVKRKLKEIVARNLDMIYSTLEELCELYDIINDELSKALRYVRDIDRDQEALLYHLYLTIRLGISIPLPVEVLSRLGNVDVRKVRDEGMSWFGNRGSVGIINSLENSKFKPLYGRVSFVNRNGVLVSPRAKMRVAPIYYIVLDKTADDYSVASSTHLQAHNFSATIPSVDRQHHPVNSNTVKCLGPDETTIVCGLMEKRHIVELYDRHNNPRAMRDLVTNIYNLDNPSSVYNLIDRSRVRYGQTSGLELSRHVLAAYGIELVYKPSSITEKFGMRK